MSRSNSAVDTQGSWSAIEGLLVTSCIFARHGGGTDLVFIEIVEITDGTIVASTFSSLDVAAAGISSEEEATICPSSLINPPSLSKIGVAGAAVW